MRDVSQRSEQGRSDPFEVEVDVRELWRVLQRRVAWVVGGLLFCVCLGAVYTMRAPRIYRGTATIKINQITPQILPEIAQVYDDTGRGFWGEAQSLATQIELIARRPVLFKAAERLGTTNARMLKDHAENPEHPQFLARLQLLGIQPNDPELLSKLERLNPISSIKRGLLVRPGENTRLVEVSFEHTSPELAAQVANAVAHAYAAVNRSTKEAVTGEAVKWLQNQTEVYGDRVESSAQALQEFKVSNKLVSFSREQQQTILNESLSQMNAKLFEIRAKRIELESRLSEIDEQQKENRVLLRQLTEVQNSPLLQAMLAELSKLNQEYKTMLQRYTPRHPSVKTLNMRIGNLENDIDREVDRVVQGLRAEHRTTLLADRQLSSEIERLKSQALSLGMKELQADRLARAKEDNIKIYNLVNIRHMEAELAQKSTANNVEVYESAVKPSRPIRPSVRYNIMVSILFGIVLGGVLAFAIDKLDNTVKSEDQLERLGLPVLGLVPSMPDGAPSNDMYILTHPRSTVAECYRTVRTNLLFMSAERRAQTLVITSSGPQEGKSTTVSNLAITMAQAGTRTIVVDTDMRRPRLHKAFELRRGIGISSVIVGEAEIDEAIIPGGHENLDIMICGAIPPNPAELFHTDSFKEVVKTLKDRYDLVLFDSPPAGLVADALVLGSMMDAVLFVVQANHTTLTGAQRCRKQLLDVGANITGVLLNAVDLEKGGYGKYYYGGYYYYGVTEGENEDEDNLQAA